MILVWEIKDEQTGESCLRVSWFTLVSLCAENVELILKGIDNRESQDVEQPDYDSVASDEDTEREPAWKEDRTKVWKSSESVENVEWGSSNCITYLLVNRHKK